MDSFFGIGLMELFVIAVIALIVLGPERLPGAMRSVANFMRQVREVGSEFTSQFSEEIKMIEEMDPRRMINDVLDPSKPTSSAAKPAAKPATSNTAAKSTPTPAKPLAATPAANKKSEENSILPPKPAADASPADDPASPTKNASAASDGAAANGAMSDGAQPDAASPAAAEADR